MYGVDRLLGNSDQMKEVRNLISRVADSPSTILITGERGTGKELVAKAIHHSSGRRTASFVPVLCSAMTEAAWENELFTAAHNGTLFFDEIGELPLMLQTKLVQVIEDKKAHRMGTATSTIVDVRIIASTTLNLESEVTAKRFRGDLYYRLKVVEIDLAPLRERRKDIPVLAETFVTRYSQEYSKPVRGISEAALVSLMHYSWPGNVRELESVIERAVTLSQSGELLSSDLPVSVQWVDSKPQMYSPTIPHTSDVKKARTLKQVEEEYIRLILEQTGGNHVQTARILGIDRRTLYRKLDVMENEVGNREKAT